ncbi:hypothetical protein [Chromobacterium sphagni]|uniref:Uncharacterized protein n=1 Tax=Chromobacterium sphagni TaxID=1903179 RepID=A0A1S1WZZ8_9NEIS|nr:hypothetical protein [Chromobacterium sphagni]OHX12648.1 hypothetical protein BI347_03375 [Chromobacterium sphagni]OHX21268.1 hypothetical protein BI344_01630 [Chromobacterium sphagni]
MKKLIAITLTLLSLLLCQSAFARSDALAQPQRIALTAPNGDIGKTKAVIVRAASGLQWNVVADQPGKLTLKHVKGAYALVLNVAYDAAGYQVSYASSENLNYQQTEFGANVHPTVNRWMDNLVRHIGGNRTDGDDDGSDTKPASAAD